MVVARFLITSTLLSGHVVALAAGFVPTDEEYEEFDNKDRDQMAQIVAQILEWIPDQPVQPIPDADSLIHVWNDKTYVKLGDMLLRIGELRTDNAVLSQRWPKGEVFYEFDSSVDKPRWKTSWRDAAQLWANAAGLTFKERVNEPNYIVIHDSRQNRSEIGMQGGPQKMDIESWGDTHVIAHEIAHALGMAHEHQGKGRSNYVTIHLKEVQAGRGSQFAEWPTTNFGSYDFGSVMHYDAYAFTKSSGNMTIEPRRLHRNQLAIMGQRHQLSALDKLGMAAIYP